MALSNAELTEEVRDLKKRVKNLEFIAEASLWRLLAQSIGGTEA